MRSKSFEVCICVMTVGNDINISKWHLCIAPTWAHVCGALRDLHTYLKVQRAPASVVTKVCATTHWTEVSSWLPLCASSVQAAMWECVWQRSGKVSGCWCLTFCQYVPEEGLCITEGTGKAELVCWPLERGGELSLARSTLRERLGCYGCKCAAVQGNGREEAFQ